MTANEMDHHRKQLGWSKREMAKRLGVHERTLHGYLRDENVIPEPIEKLVLIYAGGYMPKEV